MGQPRTDIEQPKKTPDLMVNPQAEASKQAKAVDEPAVQVDAADDEEEIGKVAGEKPNA
jgi:hypothetical protein